MRMSRKNNNKERKKKKKKKTKLALYYSNALLRNALKRQNVAYIKGVP